MKDFILKNQIKVCLVIVVLIILIGAIILQIKPSDEEQYQNYINKTVLMSLSDKEMLLDEGVFLTKNKQAYYEAYYLTDGYILNWDAEYEDGKIFKDLVLEESLEFVKQIFILSEYAKSQGVTLTEPELTSIAASVNDFMTSSSDKLIAATHATTALLNRVYARTAYYDKACEMIYKDADLTINEEDARQCLIALVEISPQFFTSPERTAETIVNRVNGGEVIGEVAKIYDCEVTKGNVGKNSLSSDELEAFCLDLKDGNCKMTKIGDIYYVVYCYLENDDEATKIAKDNLLADKKEEVRKSFCDKYEKEHSLNVNLDAWNTINFDSPIFTEEDAQELASTKK